MARIFFLLSLVVLVASFPLVNRWVSSVKHQDKREIEAVIEEYIYKHPDKVVNALSRGQVAINGAEMRKKVRENKEDIGNLSYPSFGTREGKVLLVEFFDYSCGYCKLMFPHIKELIQDGKSLIVFRDLPVLGDASVLAARAALAIHLLDPGKYIDFYYAALNYKKQFTDSGISEIVQSIGVDDKAFKKSLEENEKKIDKMIADTRNLANRLNIGGTPSVVVGNTISVGASDLQTLREMIDSTASEATGGGS